MTAKVSTPSAPLSPESSFGHCNGRGSEKQAFFGTRVAIATDVPFVGTLAGTVILVQAISLGRCPSESRPGGACRRLTGRVCFSAAGLSEDALNHNLSVREIQLFSPCHDFSLDT
jgi:hypothetical protein